MPETATDMTPDPVDATGGAPRERLIRGRTMVERRAERREAMLATGLKLFGTQGFAGTTIEEICREAYVSSRNFYEEFGSRAKLLDALSQHIAAATFSAWANVEVPSGPDQLGRSLDARLAAIVHVLVDDPRVARIAFVETMAVEPDRGSRRRDVLRLFPGWLGSYLAGQVDSQGEPAGRSEGLLVALLGAISELIVDWTLADADARPALEALIADVVEVGRLLLRP